MKKGIAIAVGVLCTFVFSILQLHSVSILTGTGAIDENYDVKQTEVYQDIYEIYEIYIEDLKSRMEAEGEAYIAEHTTQDSTEEPEEQSETAESTETAESDSELSVEVKISVRQINMSYVLAYLSMTDDDVLKQDRYDAFWNKIKILSLYEKLCTVKTEERENGFYIFNEVLSPEEAAEQFFKKPAEQRQYLYYYDGYYEFIGEMPADEDYYLSDYYLPSGSGAEGMNIPLYYQYAAPWGKKPYGTADIKKCGCGPTCIAMVVSYLNQEAVYPDDVVAWTGNRYYVAGAGSAWSIFPACASHYGIGCVNAGKNVSAVMQALVDGKPVIVSMGPGTFTKSGHFIVLRGIDENGKVLVNDPNDSASKGFYNKSFSMNLIVAESKNFWIFNKYEGART